MRINQNIAAQNAYRNLSVTNGQMAKSLEKLSSGFRINRAADDAAGLAISEGLRSQVGGLKVAVRNAQDGISVVQTAEGALTEVHALLQRTRDLAVQSSNTGANSAEARAAAATEVQQALTEIDRISQVTEFGGKQLLQGNNNDAGFVFHVGSGAGLANQVKVDIQDMNAKGLSLTGAGSVNAGGDNTGHIDGSTTPAALGSVSFSISEGTGGNTSVINRSVDFGTTTADTTTEAGRQLLQDDLQKALDGSFGSGVVKAKVEAGSTSGVRVSFETFSTKEGTVLSVTSAPNAVLGFGDGTLSAIDGTTAAASSASVADLVRAGDTSAITKVDNAIKQVSEQRANLGAYQNRLEHTIANLSVTQENLSASESRIRDTDMAQEMVSFTRAQILTQAGTAMLAQANQAPQGVLSLLR